MVMIIFSALTGLEARMALADDVNPALAPHDPAVRMAALQGLQRRHDLHNSSDTIFITPLPLKKTLAEPSALGSFWPLAEPLALV
jgi:hypothetical protein